jgi:LuxR family maltose regulon positive regulatory protein
MKVDVSILPILQTKLHRPSVPRDHLHRPHLTDRLSKGIERPLTLVSAPAGYGKSTLLSSWLSECVFLNTWFSLDKGDNDQRTFLEYFISAVQTIFPKSMTKSREMLAAVDIPQLPDVKDTLLGELSYIDEPFILVLDDFHLIANDTIHELINSIIKLSSRIINLTLATRQDPPLPLPYLRAKGLMNEIRVNDLRFSVAETTAFVEKAVGRPVVDSAVEELGAKTEGWVTALRLAALTVRSDPDLNRIVSRLPEENKFVADYILSEVVARQPHEIQLYLLKTALLNRFCIPLCNALCIPDVDPDRCGTGGREFIRWLMDANLFIIPLDSHNRWFRYHHLFQQLLRRQLARQFDDFQIKELHQRAGDWFLENGLLDEAFHHRHRAGDWEKTARFVADCRHDMMNQEQWHRLYKWMKKLPLDVVENNIELLLAKAWLCENRLRLSDLMEVVGRIETKIHDAANESRPIPNRIEGEFSALKAATCYLQGDGPITVEHARQSIGQIPEKHSSELAFALIVLALGLQMVGNGAEGRQVIIDALSRADRHVRTYHARLLFGLCFLDWLEADMHGVRQTAEQVIVFGREHDLLESLSFGHYFLGLAFYHFDDLSGAKTHLRLAVEKGKLTNINTFAHASYLLALVHQAQANPEAAAETAEAVTAHALVNHNTLLLQDAKAFQAELALRQGRLPLADHWAKFYEPFPLSPVLRYYVPPLTFLKIRIAQNTPNSLKKAVELTNRFFDYYTTTNNNRVLVEIMILKSILQDHLHQIQQSLSSLEKAIDLSRPGGNRRPFIDFGKPMADLLIQLNNQKGGDPFIDSILEAIAKNFRNDVNQINKDLSSSVEPLTPREIEVLQLLAKQLRNKEIAEKLFISLSTTKRHCANIYIKLKVKNRQDAVKRAHELGML